MYILLLFCILLRKYWKSCIYFLASLAFFLFLLVEMSPYINYFEVSVSLNYFLGLFGLGFFCLFFNSLCNLLILLLSPPPSCFTLWGWVFNKLLFRGASAFRHPFADVVIAWLHHLNMPEDHRNCRQKKLAATKGGVCPPLPTQVTAHASHCPRMESKQTSMVTLSSLEWAGNNEEEMLRMQWRKDRWSSQARLVHGKDHVRSTPSALSPLECLHSPASWREHQQCRCQMHSASFGCWCL